MAERKTLRSRHPFIARTPAEASEAPKPERIKTTVSFTREAWQDLKAMQYEAVLRGEREPEMSDLVNRAIRLLREQST